MFDDGRSVGPLGAIFTAFTSIRSQPLPRRGTLPSYLHHACGSLYVRRSGFLERSFACSVLPRTSQKWCGRLMRVRLRCARVDVLVLR